MIWNIRPKQFRLIPWGWESEQTRFGPVVVKPRGSIKMPPLVRSFMWQHFELFSIFGYDELDEDAFVSKDMKCIFATACRFLGLDRVLSEKPSLRDITTGLIEWNAQLLATSPVTIEYLIIGDELAGSTGLLMDPHSWSSWIRPELSILIDFALRNDLKVVMNIDGDVSSIMDDLVDMGVCGLHPIEQVGGMLRFANSQTYKSMKLLHGMAEFLPGPPDKLVTSP